MAHTFWDRSQFFILILFLWVFCFVFLVNLLQANAMCDAHDIKVIKVGEVITKNVSKGRNVWGR